MFNTTFNPFTALRNRVAARRIRRQLWRTIGTTQEGLVRTAHTAVVLGGDARLVAGSLATATAPDEAPAAADEARDAIVAYCKQHLTDTRVRVRDLMGSAYELLREMQLHVDAAREVGVDAEQQLVACDADQLAAGRNHPDVAVFTAAVDAHLRQLDELSAELREVMATRSYNYLAMDHVGRLLPAPTLDVRPRWGRKLAMFAGFGVMRSVHGLTADVRQLQASQELASALDLLAAVHAPSSGSDRPHVSLLQDAARDLELSRQARAELADEFGDMVEQHVRARR